MLNLFRPSCVRSVFFCLLLTARSDQPPKRKPPSHTALDRQLSRIDLGVVGLGIFNKDSNGTAIVNRSRLQSTLAPATPSAPWSPFATSSLPRRPRIQLQLRPLHRHLHSLR